VAGATGDGNGRSQVQLLLLLLLHAGLRDLQSAAMA